MIKGVVPITNYVPAPITLFKRNDSYIEISHATANEKQDIRNW